MNITDKNLVCKCFGGSHLYNLNTPQSDIDIRGIYLLDNASDIIGLNSNRDFHIQDKSKEDVEFKEFRNAMRLLKGANTQIIELLFNQNWIYCSDLWREAQSRKYDLIDSKTLFCVLKGYINGEKKLAFGEKTGKLGSKRKEAIEEYGYSPKNIVQLIRLCVAGMHFFHHGTFKVVMDSPMKDVLINIKTNPIQYEKEFLMNYIQKCENHLDDSFNNKQLTFRFNENVANELILKAYKSRL